MEAVVKVLAETLTVLRENFQLISSVAGDVDKLNGCVDGFKSFLKESRKKRIENEIVKQLVKDIMDAVYRSEDLIDQYVVDANIHAEKTLTRVFDMPKKWEVANKIKAILDSINEIQGREEYLKVIENSVLPQEDVPYVKRKVPKVEEEYVVGFDVEAKTIIQRLRDESSYEVISIFGMAGLGKTTLANKIFKSQEIEHHFMHFVWIYVSQSYKKKDVYLQILKKLQQSNDNDIRATEEELALKIKQFLEKRKYLIVLDDVWTKEAFEDILHGTFPERDGCKVLVTTRKEEVAMKVNSFGEPHRLKFLEHGESWELLEKKVFKKMETCPDDLKPYGEEVARKCDGLPLAVVIMAGVLSGKPKNIYEWRKVANSYSYFFSKEIQSYEELIRLSYDDLPYELKYCFLYLGAFPNGNDIPAAKLKQLWIAEGFIEEERELNMEGIACENLCGLVSRNLVMATQRKPDGQIKTCRVHDMLLQFCKKEAKGEWLFNEINEGTDGMNQQQGSSCRRLSVQCPLEKFISSTKQKQKPRSLLCFAASDEVLIDSKTITSLCKSFPLLKVLHFAPDDSAIFTSCNKDIFRLVHLRYIAISTTVQILPKDIEKLQNVQTLIVRTRHPTLEIKGDIWKMSRLRHFQTNASANLPSPSASQTERSNENMQTLSKVSPLSCTPAALAKASNVNKLGIRGNLAKLLETDPTSKFSFFKNIGDLKKLVNLKLFNEGEKLPRLPQEGEFPENLTKLTLSNTSLPWEQLSKLGKLKKLEILKLIERAAVGECWEPIIGEFLCLQVLHIERTDLKSWTASNTNFPRLKSLVLEHCEQLEEIPFALAHISSLQEIELKHSKKAITSAQEILNHKQNPTQNCNPIFKLTVYPPLDPSQAT